MTAALRALPQDRGWRAFAGLFCAALMLFALHAFNSPAPAIDRHFGDTSISLAAERAWSFFPGDCVTARWRLEGIQSLYIAGAGAIGWGEMPFCPAINDSGLLFEITAEDGVYRALTLPIHYLPELLFYLCGFLGALGALPLALYLVYRNNLDAPLPWGWLAAALMLLAVFGAWQRLQPVSKPQLDAASGGLTLHFWAEQDRILFPHECVAVGWSAVGAASARFNGVEYRGGDNPVRARHCAEAGAAATLELVDSAGNSENYALPLPALFPGLARAPAFIYLSLLGIALGIAIYAPLCWRLLRERRGGIPRADIAALLGCFFFVLLLYLPFGFESAGHWEEWILHGYAEGGGLSFYREETVSRFFVAIPHTLAYLISSESFFGYHLVNFSLYTLEMALLYGILRRLGIVPAYAFLMTALFLVYPVNSALMTTRRLPKNFSVMTLLLATYCMLAYCQKPQRLTLLGVWLALMYSVNSNETGFAVILFVPLLWWLRPRAWSARNLTLTVSWYLAPAFKIGYFILLLLTNRDFYQSGLLQPQAGGQAPAASAIEIFTQVMREVFSQTFIEGWRGALAALPGNAHLPSAALMTALVAAAALYLLRAAASGAINRRESRQTLLGGLLVIGASVGILMWFPLYRNDPWRMYLVVPVGAAVAAVSLLMLLAQRFIRPRFRAYAVIAACLLLMFPAASRLALQLDGFTQSAAAKAGILRQLVRQAPALAADVHIAILTDMSNEELHEKGIFELLNHDMVNSALYVLYGGAGPEAAYFCSERLYCGEFSGGETLFSAAAVDDLLARTLVFLLHQDLTVELLVDPASALGLESGIAYEARQLYTAGAPLPPRIETMLGAAET